MEVVNFFRVSASVFFFLRKPGFSRIVSTIGILNRFIHPCAHKQYLYNPIRAFFCNEFLFDQIALDLTDHPCSFFRMIGHHHLIDFFRNTGFDSFNDQFFFLLISFQQIHHISGKPVMIQQDLCIVFFYQLRNKASGIGKRFFCRFKYRAANRTFIKYICIIPCASAVLA